MLLTPSFAGSGGSRDRAIGIAVVGFGYWGPELARNIASCPGARLAAVCDRQASCRSLARQRHEGVRIVAELRELLDDPDVDAVAVATPVSAHFDAARACLEAGKHVLVEKPLARTTADARALIELASARRRVLLVDHTYAYASAVQALADCIASGDLGDVFCYDSVRINLGRFRADVDVFWDLASHDLGILDHLLGDAPTSVQAVGFRSAPAEPHQLGHLTLRWGEGRVAHVHVSWLSPVKVRRTLIGGTRGMAVWDDLDPDAKVRIYPYGGAHEPGRRFDPAQLRIGYRTGEMRAPLLEIVEPLQVLIGHFVDCIAAGSTPRTGGDAGARVVALLEAADRSLARGGAWVDLAVADRRVRA